MLAMQVQSEDADAVLGRFDTLGVAVLHSPLDARFFERVEALMAELATDRFSFMIIRAGKAPGQMPATLRDTARKVVEAHADRLIAFGYVLGGTGLKATLIRTTMNAVLTRVPFPAKTFTDLRPGLGWVLSQAGQPAALVEHEREILRDLEARVRDR